VALLRGAPESVRLRFVSDVPVLHERAGLGKSYGWIWRYDAAFGFERHKCGTTPARQVDTAKANAAPRHRNRYRQDSLPRCRRGRRTGTPDNTEFCPRASEAGVGAQESVRRRGRFAAGASPAEHGSSPVLPIEGVQKRIRSGRAIQTRANPSRFVVLAFRGRAWSPGLNASTSGALCEDSAAVFAISRLPETELPWQTQSKIADIMMGVLARHAGEEIENDADLPGAPLLRS
jgi:hypothetical protein